MDLILNIDLKPSPQKITYNHKILLIGSCFTEHIGEALQTRKFTTLQNPNGILFDPISVCRSLEDYAENKTYKSTELFQLNETFNSWRHHSRFSHINKDEALKEINWQQTTAHEFLKRADWLMITLGSSFSYQLTKDTEQPGFPVANCHRAPAKWFNKKLLSIDEILSALDSAYHKLKAFNPSLKYIFTISPVRHIRDGVVENNRSKARLIEAVHHFVSKFDNMYYFPAYELVIDVLRDYRFYDIDLVHPNYLATEIVFEKFCEVFIDDSSRSIMAEVEKISNARRHKPFQPQTEAHKNFLTTNLTKAKELQAKLPQVDFSEEISYFSSNSVSL